MSRHIHFWVVIAIMAVAAIAVPSAFGQEEATGETYQVSPTLCTTPPSPPVSWAEQTAADHSRSADGQAKADASASAKAEVNFHRHYGGGAVRGARGPQGSQGPAGPSGPQGAQGAHGHDGRPGEEPGLARNLPSVWGDPDKPGQREYAGPLGSWVRVKTPSSWPWLSLIGIAAVLGLTAIGVAGFNALRSRGFGARIVALAGDNRRVRALGPGDEYVCVDPPAMTPAVSAAAAVPVPAVPVAPSQQWDVAATARGVEALNLPGIVSAFREPERPVAPEPAAREDDGILSKILSFAERSASALKPARPPAEERQVAPRREPEERSKEEVGVEARRVADVIRSQKPPREWGALDEESRNRLHGISLGMGYAIAEGRETLEDKKSEFLQKWDEVVARATAPSPTPTTPTPTTAPTTPAASAASMAVEEPIVIEEEPAEEAAPIPAAEEVAKEEPETGAEVPVEGETASAEEETPANEAEETPASEAEEKVSPPEKEETAEG